MTQQPWTGSGRSRAPSPRAAGRAAAVQALDLCLRRLQAPPEAPVDPGFHNQTLVVLAMA